MKGFKLFVENSSSDIIEDFCTDILNNVDVALNLDRLKSYIGETLGNELKALYIEKAIESGGKDIIVDGKMDISYNTRIKTFVRNGAYGFCTPLKIQNYLNYTSESATPSLPFRFYFEKIDGVELPSGKSVYLMGNLPFKRNVCESAIHYQMGVGQYIENSPKLAQMDFQNIILPPHGLQVGKTLSNPAHLIRNPAVINFVEAQLRESLPYAITSRAFFRDDADGVNYIRIDDDFEDFNRMVWMEKILR